MTKRRCDNWLLSYRDYLLPRTDAPESFVFWSGLFTIASSLRRQVFFPKKYLGTWECYPHMYLMFVGPPGMRKTTTIDGGSRPLLKQVDGLKEGPDFFTKEAIIEKMQQSSDCSLYLACDELSNVFQKSEKNRGGMYEFLTSMYDGKETIESATKSSGTAFLEKPTLNFFSATTPGWISDNMPEGVITGGFASRCVWIYEDKLRINKMFFDDVPEDIKLEDDILLDLLHISQLTGEFTWSDDGKAAMKAWETTEPPQFILTNDKLGGYVNRRKMLTLKLAMLNSVMEKDELVITAHDWEFATNAIATIEPNLPKIFGGVGKNRYSTEVDKIVAFVRNMNFYTKQEVPLDEVLRTFQHSAEPRTLKDLIDFAVDSKMLCHAQKGSDHLFWVPEFTKD